MGAIFPSDDVLGVDKPIDKTAPCSSHRYLLCEPLDWADIRAFLVRRKHFTADSMGISDDVFNKICSGDTGDLPGNLMRECSVWIDGYKQAKL